MATLQRLANPCRQILKNYARSRIQIKTCRLISTSDKNKDSVSTTNEGLVEKSQELKELEEHFGDVDPTKLKNWESYGWDKYDRETDTLNMNIANFAFFTLVICGGGLVLAYRPDYTMREWAMREAFLEIDRRGKAGLPLIDPYMIPPEQVELPTEEEIGDQEIIV